MRHFLPSIAFFTATALTANPVLADLMPKEGDFVIRARALSVIPDEDATISGAVTGNQIDIDTSYVPELDFSYFVTDNIALEVIAGVTPHEASAKSSSAGPLDIGDVWLLPPTVTVQYHFTELDAQFKPYIGAGVNYTYFFGADEGASVSNAKYDDSFGPALQLGADYMLSEHWMLNVDAKKIWINTDASFNGGAVRADVDINPWLLGVGVGYRF